jgi:hypothetical protein
VVAGAGTATDRQRAAFLAEEARSLAEPLGAGLVTGLAAELPTDAVEH